MHIHITDHGRNFNVGLCAAEGKDAFLEIKGCRIVDGQNGRFVSWPSRKMESGKYWNHVWASEKFGAAVIAAFDKQASAAPAKRRDDIDDEIPF